ncbi:winged helix-turn-helix domain-containing protein [Pseudomonas sp. G2-4]|nr:winged helix-turn-helix domain-containing protein [Pseudomonas sp. G2-4]WHS63220.1 winged helix-turn-helix domain-containing protein [Pseudomonas sp. G2-4]
MVYLCSHPNRVLTHQQLLKAVWGQYASPPSIHGRRA